MRTETYGFINCICTYLSHIYESLFSEDDYLFFLIDKLILCCETQGKMNIQAENPWREQPFIIGNQIVQNESMFEQFCVFLERESKIKVYEKEKLSLLKQLRYGAFYCVLPVDEFYLSKSKFFNKKHNKHYVLIKSVHESEVFYFDSETMSEQKVEIKKLEQAVKSELIGECGYEVDISEAKRMCFIENVLQNKNKIPYINTEFYISIDDNEFFFYMEALRLSITFQIIPYLLMQIKYCEFDGWNLLDLYRQLTQYLLICRIKRKIDRVAVIAHLKKINIIGEKMQKRQFVEKFVNEIKDELIDMDSAVSINEDDGLVDIGMDSISFIKIIVFIETQYSIEVETEFLTMEKFQTIGDMANYVWSKINE